MIFRLCQTYPHGTMQTHLSFFLGIHLTFIVPIEANMYPYGHSCEAHLQRGLRDMSFLSVQM